ncbi:poly [ADP-ribose] polymerase 11-like [Ctenocephalides felis]|uniref:poly [ADP-ribose] polymerase 11-like n=1 Tax=Ctenocephalides felis TaxID=7515 RepID=UPI000E6E1510|nr:poly [ADP-ribose] polymerase 11-like [Ctenocephalides felis]
MSLLSDLRSKMPSGWCHINLNQQYEKRQLSSYNSEYKRLYNEFKKAFSRKGLDSVKIYEVMNPFIYGRYKLRQEEIKNVKGSCGTQELYHATSTDNVDSILSNNLDWRRVVRSKFGQGVSFSPSMKYANKECNRNCGENRTFVSAI